MDPYLGAVALGLAYAFLAGGIFITMRIFQIPDITADGSLTLGAAVTALLLTSGWSPVPALAVATVAGAVAGAATGLIHTRLRINGLLAGIIVMTALYSVNLRILGRSNLPLLNEPTLFDPFRGDLLPLDDRTGAIVLLLPMTVAAIALLAWFFRTDYGLTMRATGENETMVRAQGGSVDGTKIAGIALANGLVAMSGSLVAQYQGYADIGMGIGIIVFGLASVIIGDALASAVRDRPTIPLRLAGVVVGAILFRLLVAAVLSLGLEPGDLKLVTALFVLGAMLATRLGRRPTSEQGFHR